MNYADRVKETTTATSVATITLGGAVAPMRAFAAAFTVGTTDIPVTVADTTGKFESSVYTLTNSNTLTRTAIIDSSNGGAAETFGAGAKDVFCSVHAKELAKMPVIKDVAFSTTIPLSQAGTAYMSPSNVTGALTFTPSAGAVRGAMAILRLTVNTATMPTFSGFKQLGGSYYDNRVNAMNLLQFSYDGVQPWVFVIQEEGSVPATSSDTTTPTMNGVITSSNVGTTGYTLTWPAATDNTAVTGYEYSTNGGTNYIDVGNVLTTNVTGLSAATQYANRVRAYDAAGNRATTPLSLNVTTSAVADTIDPTMSGSLTTTNVGSSSYVMNWPAGSDNVAVAGYETSTDGGTTYSDAGNVLTRTITGATASTLYNLRVRAYDQSGRRSAALSAAVTTTAVVVANYETMITNGSTFESGTSPKTYTAIADTGPLNYGWGALWTKHVPAQTDISVQFKISDNQPQWLMGFVPNSTDIFDNQFYNGVSAVNGLSGNYGDAKGGTNGKGTTVVSAARAVATGDIVKLERTNSSGTGDTATMKAYVSKDNGSTFTLLFTVSGFPTGLMYIRWCNEGKANAITELQATGLVA